jgi:hypothetical protein
MACATLLGIAASAAAILLMGAPMGIAGLVAMCVIAGSFATFIPAVLRIDRQMWGVAVLGSSMTRTMIILAIVLVIDQSRDLGTAHKALWVAALCAAGVILVIETGAAIRILSSMEKSASLASHSTAAKA